MIFIHKGGRVVYANEACSRILGYPREYYYDADFDYLSLIAPEHREMVNAHFRRLMEGHDVPPYDYTLLTREGRRVEATITTALIEYERGRAILGIITDLSAYKRAERRLEESETFYRAIFETSGTAMLIVEDDTTISMVNDEFQKLFRFTKDEVEGQKSWMELVAAGDRERMIAYHRQRRIDPDAVPRTYEARFVTREGRQIDVLVTVSLIPGTRASVASLLDMTEYKRAQNALRESEERYRTLVESSSDAILMLTLDRQIVTCNRAFLDMFGYESDEIAGTSVRIIHPSDESYSTFGATVYPAVESTGSFRTEWEYIRKDGSLFFGESVVSAITNAAGIITGFIGTIRDISERLQAAHQLRSERETFFAMLQKAPYGVVLIERDGSYLYVNPEFTRITGYHLDDVPTGQEWFHRAYPDATERARIIAAWKQDMIQGAADRIYSVRCKDETTKQIEFRPVPLDEGRTIMMISDITERERMEEELRQERDRLQAFTQMLETKINERNREINEFRRFLDQLTSLKDQLASRAPDRDEADHLLPATLYEALLFITNENSFKRKPTYQDLQKALNISRTTARQRITELERLQLIAVERAGRAKYLTVTPRGKDVII